MIATVVIASKMTLKPAVHTHDRPVIKTHSDEGVEERHADAPPDDHPTQHPHPMPHRGDSRKRNL